jgi:hypothetical protein
MTFTTETGLNRLKKEEMSSVELLFWILVIFDPLNEFKKSHN